MARGGKREGAGRKKGALSVRTREIAEQAITEGISPLEVMLSNMRFHFAEATDLMSGLIDRAKSAGPIEASELKDLLRFLHNTRSMAEECARDAAPYIHPRLATLQVGGDPNAPLVIQVVKFGDDTASQ